MEGHINIDIDNDLDSLREHILQCQSVDANSEAMIFALRTVDEVKKEQSEGISNEKKKHANGHVSSKIRLQSLDALPLQKPQCVPNNDAPSRRNVGRPRKPIPLVTAARFVFVELPLVILFVLGLMSYMTCYIYDEYLDPQFDLMIYTDENRTRDRTFYHRTCSPSEITTLNAEDLYIQDHYTTDDAVEHMLTHGMSVYRNILKQETAADLRKWVLERNKSLQKKDEIDVISNTNRWSFYIGANDHPSVTKAIQEVATHPVFRPALEKIVGVNPAIIEMTAITSAFGAEDQFWHHDIIAEGSPAKYGQSFIPSYSLFMALQDTTAAMGATEVCPGTYMCSNSDAEWTCGEHGFQVSGPSDKWRQGDAIFMNQQSFHRGAAHVDPNGPHRALFIITFAPRPMDVRYETRLIGQGGSYSLRWDMWGHCLDDYEHAAEKMRQPWTTLRALGIYKPADSQWGWDWITQQSTRLANGDTGYDDQEKLEEFVQSGRIGLPKFLTVPFTQDMSWREYLKNTATQCKIVLTKAVILIHSCLAVILLFACAVVKISATRKGQYTSPFRNAFQFWRRIALYDVTVVLVGLAVLWRLSHSHWAMEIKNRTLYTSPFPPPSVSDDPRHVAVVNKYDVLLNDRFDFKNMASLSNALDYQGGNIQYKATIRGAARMAQNLKADDLMRLVQSILNGMKREASRLLYQNDFSDWVVLSDSDAAAFTTQAILLESIPLLKALHKEARFLLASYKYGRRYRGALAKIHSPLYIRSIIRSLMNCKGITPFYLDRAPDLIRLNNTQIEPKRRQRTKRRSLHSPRAFARVPTPFNKRPNPKRLQSLPWNATVRNDAMLVLGDIVEAQYNGIYNEYYKGKIINIREGAIIDVEYSDGERDLNLEPQHLRKFIPYYVGERVETKVFQNGDFVDAQIVNIRSDDKVVARLMESHKLVTVPQGWIRRVKRFLVGDIVGILLEDDDEIFMATVVKENKDGTVNIEYEDGELQSHVALSSLREWHD